MKAPKPIRVKGPKSQYRLVGGQIITNVHDTTACNGRHCPIHNPSDHHMRSWGQIFRPDRRIMERVCEHGVGHPDPDDPAFDRTHGCDGCCIPPNPVTEEEIARAVRHLKKWVSE